MERVLGTAQLDGNYGRFRDSSAGSSVEELLQAALESGFDVLDTAPAYGGAEAAIGDFGWQGKIHTKIARSVAPLESLNASLEALRRESVEVLYFHDPSILYGSEEEFRRVREEVPRSKAHFLGVSIYTPEEMKIALGIPALEVIQIPLNVADGRFDLGLLEQARRQRVRLYARSVFLQGLLLQEAQKLPDEMSSLGKVIQEMAILSSESHRSMLELAIGWARSFPGVIGLVLGAETPEQIHQLASAVGSGELTVAELTRLRSLGLKDSTLLDPRLWRK